MSEEHIRNAVINEARMALYQAFRHERNQGHSIMSVAAGQQGAGRAKLKIARGRRTAHAVATHPAGFSRPPLPDRQVMSGHIHRCVAELGAVHYLWVQYRYRPNGRTKAEFGDAFRRMLFDRYNEEHLQGCKTGTRRMVRYLIAVAMTDSKQDDDIRPDGYDVDRRNWNKTYRPHWLQVRADIAAIDADALYSIGSKLGN